MLAFLNLLVSSHALVSKLADYEKRNTVRTTLRHLGFETLSLGASFEKEISSVLLTWDR
jgi:hypothetical protein